MDRSIGWGRRTRSLGYVLALSASTVSMGACGGNSGNIAKTYEPLSELSTEPLAFGVPVAIRVVGEGKVPDLELSYGKLPQGLTLGEDGFIRGAPRVQGEVRRFSIRATNARGEPYSERDYTLAVGVAVPTLSVADAPTRLGDVLTFDGITWNRPINSAYVWDPTLHLVWPLKGTTSLLGQALASPGTNLDLVVAGSDAQGRFELPQTLSDARLATLAQLTWNGDSDIELVLLPDPSLASTPVTGDAPTFERNGSWMARHDIASKSGPGPEVVTLAADAPAGRYALVALKKEGGDIRTQLWLTIKARSGATLVEKRFDSLFSDSATGSWSDEVRAGRQSFKFLGSIVVSPQGGMTYEEAPSGIDPFAPPEVTE